MSPIILPAAATAGLVGPAADLVIGTYAAFHAHADHVHSNGAKHLAQEQLLDYQNDFASFVTTATASGASLTAVTGLLHAHVHDLTSYIDADVAGHDSVARQILVHAVATMHVIAKTVADAIAAQHLRTVAP